MKLLLINLSVNDNGPATIHSNGNKIYIRIITSISSNQQEIEMDDNDYEKLTKSFMVEFKGISYYGVTFQTYNTPVIKQITPIEITSNINKIEEVKEEIFQPIVDIIEEDTIEIAEIEDILPEIVNPTISTEKPKQSKKKPTIKQSKEEKEVIQQIDDIKEDVDYNTSIKELVIDYDNSKDEPIIENVTETIITEDILIETVNPTITTEVTKTSKKKPAVKQTTEVKEQSDDLYTDKTTDLYLDKSDDLYTE